jgi:hypothetical protein
MIRSSIRVAVLAALALPGAALPVSAQTQTAPPIKLKTPKPKVEKFKGEVLAFNSLQIMVRGQENERLVRTFSYTPELREQMQKLLDQGGYQHGDKVEIHHEPGSDIALKIKGKPSKPL